MVERGQFVLSWILLLLTLGGVLCKQQYALNVPRVLLPLAASGIRSNFTVTATQGCFTWSSTKPDVASVEPLVEPNGKRSCSKKAVVTAQSSQVMRLSSVIVAEEVGGGIVLRCDVFVDTISRIEITTRTRELLLEEEPERFELQALDDEGNTFSTLNGHVVEWQVLPDEEEAAHQKDPGTIVDFIPFDESTYSTDPAIKKLEAEGLQGETVLVAGISTGSVKVQAALTEKVWKDVHSSVVKLLVIENLMLVPSMDVYILPFTYIYYRVQRRKQGLMEVVPMPSSQYSLHLTNSTVARLNNDTSRVMGLVLGFTEVVLEDHNMLAMPTSTKPTAGVHVVAPHHLGFTISPDNVWVLETGRKYVIHVHIFDKNNHRIYPTENLPLKTTLPLDHLTVHYSSPNGSYHHVTAKKVGLTHAHSILTQIKHPDTDEKVEFPPISKKQPMEIYDPIEVHPPRLVLLWVEEKVEIQYKKLLKATGGSGTYIWTCSPEGVVGVTGNGTLEVLEKGMTTVIAADVKNTAHFDDSEVHVIPPAKMNFLPSRVEAVVGSPLLLPLQVLGYIQGDNVPSDPLPFLDCRHLRIKIATSDSSIFNISDDRGQLENFPEGACLILTATALSPGHTRVVATYNEPGIVMEAVVTIAAYKPLVPVDPEVVAVVTLGSSKLFLFEGGPAPWVLDRSRFYKNLTAEVPDNIDLHPWSTSRASVSHHMYRVTCLTLGEQTLSIAVGNDPTLKNRFPASAETSSRLACSLPVSMTLHPVLSHMPDCPLFGRDSNQVMQIPVLCDSILDLEVEVFDVYERPFDNFTSLLMHWDSSDHELLPLHNPLLSHHGNRATLTVKLGHQSGSVVVSVTCNSHTPLVHAVDPFSPTVRLTTSLLLRHKPQVDPPSLLLYNHPDNHASLDVLHGSGHFNVAYVPPDISSPPASMNYSAKTHQIVLVPLHEGRMRLAVQDLCLEVGRPEMVGVVVGGVYYVDVLVGDKVQVGSSLMACVQVMDSDREPFSREQLQYMNLQANPKTFHIAVHPMNSDQPPVDEGSWPPNSACYIVEGVAVGAAYLSFNATSAEGRIVSSPPKEIQVFDPLNLQPENITLLPTSTFQIQSSGGPQPQVSITYSISNETVATVNDSGLILAREPGIAVLTGRVQYNDPTLGSYMLGYSEDTVMLSVVRLTGIKIHLPVTRLLSGVTQAVYAVGLNDESPFTFGSAIPGLSFIWSVTNMDALSVMSVYDKAGVSIQEEQDFDAVLQTRNPGQGAVRLGVKCPPKVCLPDQASFSDQVIVQVLAPLRLLRPLNGHFLLPHNGRAKIVTNRDGVSMLSYHILNGCSGGKEENSVIMLGRRGEVKAAAVNGHAVVKVTESEEELGLNQTLIVHVEVRPISSLSISSLSTAHATPHSNNHAFPLGYSAIFIAYLHDNVGRRFDFAEVSLSHHLNRLDTVIVTPESGNSTYSVKSTKQGDVIMKIWATSLPHVADYVRIRVAYAILPSLGVVHLGSTVCFMTHLLEHDPGTWEMGEGSVMEVEEDSGVAQALAVGRTVIYHKITGVVDSHTEITVAKVERIELGPSTAGVALEPFTNGRRLRMLGDYLVPVLFYANENDTFTPLQFSTDKRCTGDNVGQGGGARFGKWLQQVNFDCNMELNEMDGSNAIADEYISAQSVFNAANGLSYCKLSPLETQSAESLAVKEDLQLKLKVIAGDFSRSYFVVSEQVEIPFVPAFYIGRKEVFLSTKDGATEVIVHGLQKQIMALKVTSPYPLSVVRSSMTATSAVYKISLLSDYHSPPEQPFTNLTVSFTSPLAQQEELVTVQLLESDQQTCEPATLAITPKPSEMRSQEALREPPLSPGALNYFPIAIFIGILFVLLVFMVMCVALQKSSPSSGTGFQQHLAPSTGAGGQTTPQSPSPTQYSPSSSPTSHLSPTTGGGAVPFTPSTSYMYPGSASHMTTPQQQQQQQSFASGLHPTPSLYRRTRASVSPKQPGLFSS